MLVKKYAAQIASLFAILQLLPIWHPLWVGGAKSSARLYIHTYRVVYLKSRDAN